MTLTQFHFSFYQALLLAAAWMEEGRCSSVLVGATEECGAVMEYVCSARIRLARSGRIEPLRFGTPGAVPGEGSVFFLLTREEPRRRYAELRVAGASRASRPDLVLVDADGLTSDEMSYRQIDAAVPVAAYSPLFGSMLTGTAFHCAAAALMLRDGERFACPVTENPHGLDFPVASEPLELREIECVRYDCGGERAAVRIHR
jgi:hypothetical protein